MSFEPRVRKMRSRDQHLNDALQTQRKRKPASSREKFTQSLARSRWPKVAISRGKDTAGRQHGTGNNLPPFAECANVIGTSDSNVIACDIVELFCENSDASNVTLEERTTHSRTSSSTELEEDAINVCSTCENCAECQLRGSTAKIREAEEDPMNDRPNEKEHFDYYEGDTSETASTSVIEHKAPILVDLTSEESKAAWKQTILKRYGDTENSEMLEEPRIMIADSSNRLQRSSTSGSLATALRDRGPCVIPVQPNRSLPIRPAPPAPTRSASIVTSRKTRSPILKLSKSVNLDAVQVQREKSLGGVLTNELTEFPFGPQDGKSDKMMLTSELIERSDYILPDNVVQITQEMNSVKKKNSENQDREYEKEITKDVKKRRKSHEVDLGHDRDERVEKILKEYSRTCSSNLTDKAERRQQVMLGLWDDKKSSVIVSTTEPETERTKDICNKVVPPLRLKKVVREASTTDEYYRNVEVSAESGAELNYRIVTGATPRPESPSDYSISVWSNASSEKETDTPSIARDKSRRCSPKSDGYKIKYRRNRLRQKLRELRGKALKLSREMAVSNNADMSPQHSTRLRQMMNCYEKQIENISKLLCKLSASIPPTSTDNVVVDLDYENELDDCTEKTADGDIVHGINGAASRPTVGVSPSPSPEPPKLSPRSPVDYERGKSPHQIRDSPPVLPRVYIAIQPATLECLKQNLNVAKNWKHGSDSSSMSVEKGVKVDGTDRTTIRRGDVTESPATSPVSSSEYEGAKNGAMEWDSEESSSKLSSRCLKDSVIEKKISKDTKIFDDVEEHRRATPPISTNSFLDPAMNIEIDVGDTKDTKESAAPGCLDEAVTQAAPETHAASKQVACEKQESERSRSSETLLARPSILEETRKVAEPYGTTYDSEERINGEGGTVASKITAAQETSTIAGGRPQVSASNVTNILQLQSNYYGSSVARDNVVPGVIQNTRNAQKVASSVSQPVALDPTMSLTFSQSGSIVSSSNQQCVVLPNSCNNEGAQENAGQRNDGNRIMTEQFPTLGNWVARMSKKQINKSKSKLQSGVTLPTASTAEVARVPGLAEAQKVARASVPNNAVRNNIVNVAPQWNTERWQRQQHQQRQQQLYAAASSAAPTVRPGICPPISVTQFYPPNYAMDPYGGGASFGYHTAMCPYGDYSYHSRLHAPPLSGYQIPLQDPHASSLRQMQHLDKRFPHLQEAARHITADLLKYPPTLSAAGSYQHTAAGLDFERLRTATAATQNGTAPAACLPPLLLPPPPPLPATAQQTLTRTAPLAGYPSSNGQCGRNRMIPDVVAAAAAAAVVAAASFGRQRGPLTPYGRTDAEMVSGGIGGVIDNESTQLMPNRSTNHERLSEQVQSVASGVNVDSRLNNGSYRQLQNLILDRLPYVKTDDAYPQSAIFSDNAQESAASSVSSSTYKSAAVSTSGGLVSKESARKENRNCDTPHLGKVNRTLETTNILECSNCGMTGSMFKCLGCEAAFYCDERCQTRHWSIHVEKCPKRMPKLKKLV